MNNPANAARMNHFIDMALGGSNWEKGYTHQRSAGDPNYIKGGVGVNINRERFNDWGFPGAAAVRMNQQAHVARECRDQLTKAAADRQAVGSGETKHTVSGAADLNVKISAPAGTSVNASSSGLFQKTNIERNVQMTPATSRPAQTNLSGYLKS
jgi:hypothetical protein